MCERERERERGGEREREKVMKKAKGEVFRLLGKIHYLDKASKSWIIEQLLLDAFATLWLSRGI